MNLSNKIIRRTMVFVAMMALLVVTFAVVKTTGQTNYETENNAKEKWEYLAVAGPSTTSFTATGGTRVRKEPDSSFGREAYVLEQHLDKLGASGWELVTVAGPPTDPVYYFKRRK